VSANIFYNHQIFTPENWDKLGLNRGLFFGESPFTTIRLSGGSFLGLNHHLRRLARSIYFLWNSDFKEFEKQILDGLKSLHENEGEFYFRITFVKNLNNEVDFFIYKLPFVDNEGELHLEVSNTIKGKGELPNYLKIGNYTEHSCELRKRGCSELIYFNYEGELLECGTNNIFLIKDQTILTPSLVPGVLDGICRSFLLDFLRSRNFIVRETKLLRDDLETCDEVWLTNALRGVRAAHLLGTRKLERKFFKEIDEEFITFVRNYDQA